GQVEPGRPAAPLIGRSVELEALEQARTSVRDSGRLVTVTGEAGIGKTRLLGELAAAASAAGNRVATGRCHQGEQSLAFGVLSDVLRTALRVAGPAAEAVPSAWTREVSRLLPELASPGGSAALDSPGAQSRFYAALVGTLAAVLGRGGVVVLEDLQWADDSSVAVLCYLIRRLPQIPLLVVLSWRPDALPAKSALPAAAGELRRARLLTPVEPARLPAEVVRELAMATLAPDQATPATIARLTTETGGLPLFVTEYLDAFRRDGVPAGSEWALPGGVRDLLHARLTGLAETTGQVLAAAAILGSDADQPTLRATSGRGEDEVVDALEEARSRAVLVETGPAEHIRYAFAHDGLRRLVSDTTSLARRRLLHGRAADALLGRRDAGLSAATIAGHLRQAGRDAEAAEWSWRAAQRARSLYAHAEALEQLHAAVALGYPGHLVHQVAGDVLTVLGRYADAMSAYERAAASCPADDRRALAGLEHKLAEVHHRLGEWDVAASHLAAALELIAGAGDPALHARMLADLALVTHRRQDPELAARTAEEALALAASTGDAAALAQAYDVLGVLAAQRGDFELAGRRLEASLDHARRLDDPSLRVAALNNQALVLAAAGRPDEAVRIGREALARGLEHGDRHRAAALHTNLADLLHAAGQQAEALDHLKTAAGLFAGVDDTEVRRPEIWKLAQW
ncbi:MAG: AAA family ATPase, partial [Actinomycetota bacterium]|nr:AAA family ATPase [Actinomycetota bacterium]